MGLGRSVGVLAVGRAFTGLAAATWVPLIAVFSNLFSPAEAVFASSLLTLAGSLGRTLATGASGFLNEAGGYVLVDGQVGLPWKTKNLLKSVFHLFNHTSELPDTAAGEKED